MRTLAKFHAASVVLHEQDPNSMKEYDNSFFADPGVHESWSGFFSGRGINNKNYCFLVCDAIIIF
jgi:hypothetical protein